MSERAQLWRCETPECECGRGLFETEEDLRSVRRTACWLGSYIVFHDSDTYRRRNTWRGNPPRITSELIRQTLEDGAFELFFNTFHEDEPSLNDVVMLAAIAMQLGIALSTEKRGQLRQILKKKLSSQLQRLQFRLALRYHLDGRPWDLFDPGCDVEKFVQKVSYSVTVHVAKHSRMLKARANLWQ